MESHCKQMLIESLRLIADNIKKLDATLHNAQLTGGDRNRLTLLRNILDQVRGNVRGMIADITKGE